MGRLPPQLGSLLCTSRLYVDLYTRSVALGPYVQGDN